MKPATPSSDAPIADRGRRATRQASSCLALLAALLLLAAITPGPATAALTRPLLDSFGTDGTSGTSFSNPSALAFDQSSKTLYALEQGSSEIHAFDASTPGTYTPAGGNFPLSVAGPGGVPDLAVDSSSHNLYYLSESTGLYGFDSSGADRGGNFPVTGFGDPCGAATDPSGNVWVGDFGAQAIKGYDSAGNSLGSPSPVDTSGQGSPCHVAFDSAGNLYVAIYFGGVWRYSAASGYTSATEVDPGSATGAAIAVDRSTDTLYVSHGSEIAAWDSSGTHLYDFGGGVSGASYQGVAVDQGTDRVFASDSGNGAVHVFGPTVNPPTATTNPATTIHHTDAILNGHLDPGADPGITGCRFDWLPNAAFQDNVANHGGDGYFDLSSGGTVPCDQGNSFTAPADVTALLNNLTPGTNYHFRLDISTTASGDVVGNDQTVTPPAFPAIRPLIATVGSSGSGDGQFSANRGVGIDQGTGDLYVADGANHRVLKLDADGNFISAWGWGVDDGSAVAQICSSGCQGGIAGSGAGQFKTPRFVAVDNSGGPSDGDVYVGDTATNLVQKFDSSGDLISSWGTGGRLDGSTASDGPFGPLAGIAVDSAGTLLVTDARQQLGPGNFVYKFAQDGSFTTDFATVRGTLPNGLAVDSSGNFFKVNGDASVEELDPSGADIGQVTDISHAGTAANDIAVDPATGDLYVVSNIQVLRYHFDGSGAVVQADGSTCTPASFSPCGPTETSGSGQLNAPTGIAFRGDRTYVSDPDQLKIFGAPVSQEPPTVTAVGATAITVTGATLNAKVDPEGFSVTACHFDYGRTAAYGQSAPCLSGPGSGSGDKDVAAALTGLEAGSTYHFRIVASNANPGGTATGPDQSFDTPGPRIAGTGATDVSDTAATLQAAVNPAGQSTTYQFEYGTDTTYGQVAPASAAPIDSGTGDVSVGERITGLQPATTYHFRAVAVNATGVDHGLDVTFTTYLPPPTFGPCPNDALRTGPGSRLPDCRAYEQASPLDKGGENMQRHLNLSQASAPGDRITFGDSAGLPTTGGSAQIAAYLATRGPGGWSTNGTLPRTDPGRGANLLGWNDALTSTLSSVGGSSGVALSLGDTATGTWQNVLADVALQSPALGGFADDPLHFTFQDRSALVPGAASEAPNLYDLDHGSLTLAGRVPAFPATSCDDQSGPACVVPPAGSFAGAYDWPRDDLTRGGPEFDEYTQDTISADGSKVFFTGADTGRLYMRKDKTSTVQISASQAVSDDPNGHKPAIYLGATHSGSKVFFASCERLTDDSTAVSTADDTCTTSSQGRDLYTYDTATAQLTDLSVDTRADPRGADVRGFLGASADGSVAYFVANGVLAPGAAPGDCQGEFGGAASGSCNLYLSRNGGTSFIGRLTAERGITRGDVADWLPSFGNSRQVVKTSRVAPDGTLVFSSVLPLTGYDNSPPTAACDPSGTGTKGTPCSELFRYRPGDPAPTCISCNPTGAEPTGAAVLESENGTTGLDFALATAQEPFLPRNVSADGSRVFFETPDPLVAADLNGVTDPYEWEADGTGSCQSSAADGGCLYLLSTGHSPIPSFLADTSASGDDAFIFTHESLVPQDRDQLNDVYDVRVDGGLASQQQTGSPPCSGDACQGPPPAPPADQSPGSSSLSGPGNQGKSSSGSAAPSHRHRCKKHHRRCRRAHRPGSKERR